MLKVKITKCKDKSLWYSEHIGEVFFVDQSRPVYCFGEWIPKTTDRYYLVNKNIHVQDNHFINKKDCKEII